MLKFIFHCHVASFHVHSPVPNVPLAQNVSLVADAVEVCRSTCCCPQLEVVEVVTNQNIPAESSIAGGVGSPFDPRARATMNSHTHNRHRPDISSCDRA